MVAAYNSILSLTPPPLSLSRNNQSLMIYSILLDPYEIRRLIWICIKKENFYLLLSLFFSFFNLIRTIIFGLYFHGNVLDKLTELNSKTSNFY